MGEHGEEMVALACQTTLWHSARAGQALGGAVMATHYAGSHERERDREHEQVRSSTTCPAVRWRQDNQQSGQGSSFH